MTKPATCVEIETLLSIHVTSRMPSNAPAYAKALELLRKKGLVTPVSSPLDTTPAGYDLVEKIKAVAGETIHA